MEHRVAVILPVFNEGAAAFWKKIGETSSTANPSSVIDPAFVNGFGSG